MDIKSAQLQMSSEYHAIKKWIYSVKRISDYEDQNKFLYDSLKRKDSIDWTVYPSYRKTIIDLKIMNYLFDWRDKWEFRIKDIEKKTYFFQKKKKYHLDSLKQYKSFYYINLLKEL